MTDVVCVIDAGTTSVRCGLVDTSGRVVAQRSVDVEVAYPATGAAEQDPDGMWEASAAAVRAAIDDAPTTHIVAVTVSSQRASIAGIGHDGSPVTPFLLWMDQRGEKALDELDERTGAEAFSRHTGLPFGAMPSVARILWLRTHHPDVFARVHRFVGVQDWITSRLTQANTPMDASCAGWTGLFDPATNTWSEYVLDSLGLSSALLPGTCQASDQVGRVSQDVAARLGILAGTPVHAGGGDQQCSSVGAGVVAIGQSSLNLGTSATYLAPSLPGGPIGSGIVRTGHLLPGIEDREGTIPACGSAISWLARLLHYGEDQSGYERMMHEAAEVPAGSDGLSFVPALAGLGTPSWAGGHGWARGFALSHTRGHLTRSSLEGIGLQFRHILVELRQVGAAPTSVALIGGAARSDFICQLIADVADVPTVRPDGDPQLAAIRGAAACSWVGLGEFDSFEQAVAYSGGNTAEFEPTPSSVGIYAELFDEYLANIHHQRPDGK